jgi:hypothetical protein
VAVSWERRIEIEFSEECGPTSYGLELCTLGA